MMRRVVIGCALVLLALGCGSVGRQSPRRLAGAALAARLWEHGVPNFRAAEAVVAVDAAEPQTIENIAAVILANTVSSEGQQLIAPDVAVALATEYDTIRRHGGG